MNHYSKQAKFVTRAYELLRAAEAEIDKAIANERKAPCPDASDYEEAAQLIKKAYNGVNNLYDAIDAMEDAWRDENGIYPYGT